VLIRACEPYEYRPVLEVHLGWAAKGLGQKIQRMLEEQQKVQNCVSASNTTMRPRLTVHRQELLRLPVT